MSRRHFLRLMGYLGLVSVGGFGSFLELYKKKGMLSSSATPTLVSPTSISSSPSPTAPPLLQTAFAQSSGGGSWSLGQNTTVVAIHAALTYTGKIFYYSGSGNCINNENGPYPGRLLDPTTGAETSLAAPDDLWCGGAAQLPNGNILFVGGTILYDTDVNNCNGVFHGASAAYEFDVPSGTLIKQTSMAHGRWYPSLITLPNGNVIVVSGNDQYGSYNKLAELYNSSSKSWTIQYDPTSNNTYCVGAGQTACPGAGSPCYGGPNQGVSFQMSLYPRMYLMPSGLVFTSGQQQNTNLWDPSSGAWTNVNLTSQTFRAYGTSILLPLQNTTSERGKVMIVGGSTTGTTAATAVVEIEDFNQGTSTSPVLRTVASLNFGRKFVLPIILPNGKVVVFGGTSQGTSTNYVFIPEMFDPENEAQGWVTLPAATVGRTYHGVSLLLPDGSVWTASSTPSPCTNENRTEIFKPAYFSATRPTISGTLTVGGYGQSITIPTPSPSSISRVSLVGLGAATHHFDTNIRLIWLQITGTGSNSITVSAPLNANLAPPGYYMIHVLDSSLVPSTAQIVKIPGTGSGVSSPPAQVTGLAVTSAGSTQLNLSWTANTEPDLNHYNIYRSTTNGFTVNTATDTPIASPTTNSYSNTGLAASTTYYYRVAAVNNAGLIGPVSAQSSARTSRAWSGYAGLGGSILGNPAVARNSDGRLEGFVIGSDHALYHISQTAAGSSSWTGFSGLGGYIISNPVVAQNADGRLEVFVIGSDHALYHISQTAAGSSSWTGFSGLGGYIISNPAVARNSDGRLEVFVIGSDQAVYHNFQTTPSSNSWSGYASLAGTLASNTDPAAALNSDGQLELFVVGTNSAIYYKFEITPGSSSWTLYTGLGGIVNSNPVVATNSDGRLELFVIGTDQALYHNFQT